MNENLAFLGALHPRKHVHECRFAGSVFSDERMYFPPSEGEVDVIVGHDAWEALDHAAHGHGRVFGISGWGDAIHFGGICPRMPSASQFIHTLQPGKPSKSFCVKRLPSGRISLPRLSLMGLAKTSKRVKVPAFLAASFSCTMGMTLSGTLGGASTAGDICKLFQLVTSPRLPSKARTPWRTASQQLAQPPEITTYRSWHTLRHGFGAMACPFFDGLSDQPRLRKR